MVSTMVRGHNICSSLRKKQVSEMCRFQNRWRRFPMSIQGIPAGGLKTVAQIVGTNELRFHAAQNGLAIAVEILSSHVSGAPVTDDQGKFIGFISEFDVLGAIEAGKHLEKTTA